MSCFASVTMFAASFSNFTSTLPSAVTMSDFSLATSNSTLAMFDSSLVMFDSTLAMSKFSFSNVSATLGFGSRNMKYGAKWLTARSACASVALTPINRVRSSTTFSAVLS
ncbi:hypothetical protein Vafri_16075 [Volvox africanus]|uniref:Uncharacterized protein n=1 Tax=Volvox africanus TaxID=51714 RepID=A0A8J4F8F2_9CHLO|nr:hypothetical protein Vafri_16075 [Volvox africanus]